jgi:hypothetical protein
MSILVRVTKAEPVDEDIAQELLSKFTDWLDEKGVLNDSHGFKYNIDLVKTFLEEYE